MSKGIRTGLQTLVVVIFLLPLVWMTATAFQAPGTPLPTSLRLFPAEPTVANFGRIFTTVPMLRFTLNSLLVVALAVIRQPPRS